MRRLCERARHVVARLRRLEEGQDLLEYGLLVALIAIVVMAAVSGLGTTLNAVFWGPIVQNF
jgi:Flp pilus assembly pilin Flp